MQLFVCLFLLCLPLRQNMCGHDACRTPQTLQRNSQTHRISRDCLGLLTFTAIFPLGLSISNLQGDGFMIGIHMLSSAAKLHIISNLLILCSSCLSFLCVTFLFYNPRCFFLLPNKAFSNISWKLLFWTFKNWPNIINRMLKISIRDVKDISALSRDTPEVWGKGFLSKGK